MKKTYIFPSQRSIQIDEQQMIAQTTGFNLDSNKTSNNQDGEDVGSLSRDANSGTWDNEW